jgi:hypothetical protein
VVAVQLRVAGAAAALAHFRSVVGIFFESVFFHSSWADLFRPKCPQL